MLLLISILQLCIIPLVSPFCIGCIRKVKAILQGRVGASVFQPYYDIRKLFHKDEVVSKDASWIFYYTPHLMFSITLMVGASIPLVSEQVFGAPIKDMIMLVYVLALGAFFLMLAGIDTGGAFGGFGSSREATISALAEGGMLFSLLTIALVAGDTNISAMTSAHALFTSTSLLPGVLACIGFCIVLLAENARFPFDNPATHLELTMVHEAMILEYSGKRLALIEWASANRLFSFIALWLALFFPFGLAEKLSLLAILGGIFALLLKTVFVCVGIGILETSIAKLRFFRLPDLLFTAFIINVVAISILYTL